MNYDESLIILCSSGGDWVFFFQNHLIFDFFGFFANKKAKPNCAVGSRPSSPTTLHFRTGRRIGAKNKTHNQPSPAAHERTVDRATGASIAVSRLAFRFTRIALGVWNAIEQHKKLLALRMWFSELSLVVPTSFYTSLRARPASVPFLRDWFSRQYYVIAVTFALNRGRVISDVGLGRRECVL